MTGRVDVCHDVHAERALPLVVVAEARRVTHTRVGAVDVDGAEVRFDPVGQCPYRVLIRDVQPGGDPARQTGRHGLRTGLVEVRHHDGPGALRGKPFGEGLSDATRAPGDHSDRANQPTVRHHAPRNQTVICTSGAIYVRGP